MAKATKKKAGRPKGSTNGKADETTTDKFDRILMGRLNVLASRVDTLDKLNARGWKKADEHSEKMNKGIDFIIERLDSARPTEDTKTKAEITLKDIMGEPEQEPEPEPTKTKPKKKPKK